ncbi:MAG: HD domain-containing protein [Muribaculaceae bacterium]|nr:HD domain-containing protein [Muribaculaceae bacterium]
MEQDFSARLADPIFKTVGSVADRMGREAYVVGGYVRDLILGIPSKDIDFVTVGSGIELAREVARSLGRDAHLATFANFGTAQVTAPGVDLEFVGARRESYSRESRNPIVEDGTLTDDLNRRDFTINAMAICVNGDRYGELVDLFDGRGDIERRVIRTPLDPDTTFSDDPLRMLRAIRFATRLGFTIEPETFKSIKRNAHRMEIITRERINDELMKIMRTKKPSVGFRILDMAGLLPYVLSELEDLKGVETRDGKGHKDNFAHTLQVLDNVAEASDDEWLRWAALLHDIAKPACKRWDPKLGWTFHAHNIVGEKMVGRIFKKMKMPLNDRMKFVAKMVGMHMRPQNVAEEGVTDSGVRRLITDAGEDIDALMTLCEADITSKNPEKVRRQLEGFKALRKRMEEVQAADDYRNWKNPVNGREIMDRFGLPPGPKIAEIKEAIKEAILDGRVANDHDAAWAYAEEWVKEHMAKE